MPLFGARFSSTTLGYQRFVNVTKVQEAEELVAPLPGQYLRVPVSTANTMCAAFTYTTQPYERNFTAAITVAVHGRQARCSMVGLQPCVLHFDVTKYAVLLSAIPNTGACRQDEMKLMVFDVVVMNLAQKGLLLPHV